MTDAAQMVRFCRFARSNGFSAGVTETLAAVQAVRVVLQDPHTVKWALRASLCSSKEEWDKFDRVFDAFFSPSQPRLRRAPPKTAPEAKGFWVLEGESGNAQKAEQEAPSISGASVYERLKKTDFSLVAPGDQSALEQLAQRLLRQMSWRMSRRLKLVESRQKIDLRRTIRSNISLGGDPVRLRFKGKKPQAARLVILLDVSGSMSLYSLFLLRFTHALHRYFKRADTFIFSTRLVNVGGMLKSPKLADALKSIADCHADWAGGTRIGASLSQFNFLHGRLLSRDTVFIVLSDGWDTGDPGILGAELRKIRRRVRKVIWLNPLLGLEEYQPLTRGMAASLPFVDVFAPAHSLESLLELQNYV